MSQDFTKEIYIELIQNVDYTLRPNSEKSWFEDFKKNYRFLNNGFNIS